MSCGLLGGRASWSIARAIPLWCEPVGDEARDHLPTQPIARGASHGFAWCSLGWQVWQAAIEQRFGHLLGGHVYKVMRLRSLMFGIFYLKVCSYICLQKYSSYHILWFWFQEMKWTTAVQVALEGNKIVPVKPKMFLTCTIVLEPHTWVQLPAHAGWVLFCLSGNMLRLAEDGMNNENQFHLLYVFKTMSLCFTLSGPIGAKFWQSPWLTTSPLFEHLFHRNQC